jgi:hypothetical protein
MAPPHVSLRLSKDDPCRRRPRIGNESGLGFRTFCKLARPYQECGGARPGKSVNETFHDLALVIMIAL